MKAVFRAVDIKAGRLYYRGSAADKIEKGIVAWELNDEEADNTCFFGGADCICSTCTPNECRWYFAGGDTK